MPTESLLGLDSRLMAASSQAPIASGRRPLSLASQVGGGNQRHPGNFRQLILVRRNYGRWSDGVHLRLGFAFTSHYPEAI